MDQLWSTTLFSIITTVSESQLAIEIILVIQGPIIQQHILCLLPYIDIECRKFLDGDIELFMMELSKIQVLLKEEVGSSAA